MPTPAIIRDFYIRRSLRIPIVLIAFASALMISSFTYAQNKVERIGIATAKYYGSAVILTIISESRCRSFLKISLSEFELSTMRRDIGQKVRRHVSDQDAKHLPSFFADTEASMRRDFSPTMFVSATDIQCARAAEEYTSSFVKHKGQWELSVK
jgi:hypothetical protein